MIIIPAKDLIGVGFMIANQAHLFKLLNGTKQFIIPIYQRTYSWNPKQCEKLWKDILMLTNSTLIFQLILSDL
ncbi:Uncharacterised protein [uncultured archaeon]|nr:Uncharacterised protein [uncultured archaeon]